MRGCGVSSRCRLYGQAFTPAACVLWSCCWLGTPAAGCSSGAWCLALAAAAAVAAAGSCGLQSACNTRLCRCCMHVLTMAGAPVGLALAGAADCEPCTITTTNTDTHRTGKCKAIWLGRACFLAPAVAVVWLRRWCVLGLEGCCALVVAILPQAGVLNLKASSESRCVTPLAPQAMPPWSEGAGRKEQQLQCTHVACPAAQLLAWCITWRDQRCAWATQAGAWPGGE